MNLHQPIGKKVAPGTSLLHLLFTCCHHVSATMRKEYHFLLKHLVISLSDTHTYANTHSVTHTPSQTSTMLSNSSDTSSCRDFKKRKSDLGFRFKHLNWIKVRDTLNPEKHTHPDSHRVTPLRSLHRRKSLSAKSANFNISCKIVSPPPHALIPKPARVVRLVNPEEKLRLQT